MTTELISLSLAVAWTGFVHCLCGPDHYVPFVAMSRVGSWSLRKTLVVTFFCGIGHVLGSAILGFAGVALGLIVFQLNQNDALSQTESIRGDIAAWMLFAFGAAYTLGGIIYAMRKDRQADPGAALTDSAADGQSTRRMTPWILFIVFLFGPCEPLIPYLMYPAVKANMWGVAWITFLFGVTTLATMITLVTLIYTGTFAFRFHALQRWGHAVAGLVVMVCGGAMLSGL